MKQNKEEQTFDISLLGNSFIFEKASTKLRISGMSKIY
jgi:hypothetical protein